MKDLENQVSKLTLVIEDLQGQLNLKVDKDKLHNLLRDKELESVTSDFGLGTLKIRNIQNCGKIVREYR